MKRQIAIFMVIALLLALTACGGTRTENAKEDVLVGKTSPITKESWSPSKQLSDIPKGNLTLPALEAETVKVSFTQEEEQGLYEYPKGEVSVQYALSNLSDDAPSGVREVFQDFNKWSLDKAKTELSSGIERWHEYWKQVPEDKNYVSIYLTPQIGINLTRSDTSIISYVSSVYCWNRDYEPDMRLLYGHTFDAQSGRELSLNDFISDPEALADILCDEFIEQSAGAELKDREAVYGTDEFKKTVHESISGCRDDGCFAWSVSPIGFEFYFTDGFYEPNYFNYSKEDVLIPFSMCKELLCQEVGASYDFVAIIDNNAAGKMLGIEEPLEGDVTSWHAEFIGHKDGKDYLYLSGDDLTLTYRINEDNVEYLGKMAGEIYWLRNEVYDPVLDPDGIDMKLTRDLVFELDILEGVAALGEDGKPYLTELYTQYNRAAPITTLKKFKADSYPDLQSTNAKKESLKDNTALNFVRTDGETFVDVQEMYEEGDKIYRLYISGSYEEGWTINGQPAGDLISTEWNWDI